MNRQQIYCSNWHRDRPLLSLSNDPYYEWPSKLGNRSVSDNNNTTASYRLHEVLPDCWVIYASQISTRKAIQFQHTTFKCIESLKFNRYNLGRKSALRSPHDGGRSWQKRQHLHTHAVDQWAKTNRSRGAATTAMSQAGWKKASCDIFAINSGRLLTLDDTLIQWADQRGEASTVGTSAKAITTCAGQTSWISLS